MAREVTSQNDYKDKLVKLIPTEIVGTYMVLAGMLGYGPTTEGTMATTSTNSITIQVVFVILLLLTPVYLKIVSQVTNKIQILLSTGSFVVWVYTLGGPFIVWNMHDGTTSSVILVLWSLIPPLFVKASSET